MSLNKEQLKTDLRGLYDGTLNSSGSAEEAREDFVNKLSDIIDTYIKSVEISYKNGLVAGVNPVTGIFNFEIS